MQRHIYELCSQCVLLFFSCLDFFKIIFSVYVRESLMEERDVSVVTITRYSCRRPRFGSQNPYGGSQSSLSPVPTDLMPSSGLPGYQARTWCTHMHTSKTHIKGNEKHLRTKEKFYEWYLNICSFTLYKSMWL